MPGYARVPLLVALALATITVLAGAQPAGWPRPQATVPTPRATEADVFRSAHTYPTVALPVRLRIPALRVDSRLQRLDLQPDGTIGVPASPRIAGWYQRGPRPGQPGPAVILGHVDSHTGPGVFVALARVRLGTLVRVDRADGSSVTFRITKVSRVPKKLFPTDLVYAPTLDASLRLVTCGGSFDRTRRSYRDNVIAYADEV
jgi:hypothetical protein